MRRTFASLLAATALIALSVLLPDAACADPPLRLDEQVTDTARALGGDRADVERALADLQSAQDVQLWLAYVPSFEGRSGAQWAQETAELSGLGGNDTLFAVAVEDRAYGRNLGDLPVSDEEFDEILAREVEPQLAAGDWAAAGIALAEGLTEAGAGTEAGTDAGTGASTNGGLLPWAAGIAVLAALGAGAFLLLRRRPGSAAGNRASRNGPTDASGAAGEPAPQEMSLEDVRNAAAAALIEADDCIKTSEQELGFAIAQFGEESSAPFTAALAKSKVEVARAFALQHEAQQQAGTPAERATLEQVTALCRSADACLDEQVADFDKLRDLDSHIDQTLPELGTRVESLRAELASATQVTETLRAANPPQSLTTVSANLEEARQRVEFAAESVTVGTTLLAESDRNGAVARARAAEEAISQAQTLVAAVQRAPADLDSAREAVAGLIIETEKDIAEAQALGESAGLAGPVRYASETLASARASVDSGSYDPMAVRQGLEESDGALEKALEPVRDAAVVRERAQALLTSQTDAARASIQAADDFIRTRRGGIGAEARTRLAAAQREFDRAATVGDDPAAALQAMQDADHLADESLALAQRDEAGYQSAQQRGGGVDAGNVVLGGILVNSMLRAGRRPSGDGGTSGGGTRGSGSRGGRGPGSFGGGGTRGRRSGGGRF